MASSKKPHMAKQCRIYQWIEDQDPKFAEAITDLCLEGALSPTGNNPGVTFLYPKDDAYREEIINKTYTKQADEAERMIEALILPDVFINATDFKSKPVGNRMRRQYEFETIEGKKVKIAGMELEAATGFEPLKKREGRISVWVITKGRPKEGKEYTPPKRQRSEHKGGAYYGGAPAPSSRASMAIEVETAYDACMREDKCRRHNPYLAKVVSLLNYLKANHQEVFNTVLPMIDLDPGVTFYLLLEPFKTRGEYLIQDAILFGSSAWNGGEVYTNAVEEFKKFFAAQEGTALCCTDRAGLMSKIDSIRQQCTKMSQAPAVVTQAYEELATRNTIGGVGPVYPESTKAALQNGKKLWQDEFRFIVANKFCDIRRQIYEMDGAAAFRKLVSDLRSTWPGNDYKGELHICCEANIQKNVAFRAEYQQIAKFMNSTDFLYLPVAAELVGPERGSLDPDDLEVFNRNAVSLKCLEGIIGGMRRAAGVSDRAVEEVRTYVATHGHLPPGIADLVK